MKANPTRHTGVSASTLDAIGDTPLLDIGVGIFAKCEFLNNLVNDTLGVASADAVVEMRRLARSRGLFCGPSSGAHLLAARRIREQHPELATVVTILDDEGEKCLHDFFMPAASGADKPLPFH